MVIIDQSYTISIHAWLSCGVIADTNDFSYEYSKLVWEILRSNDPRSYADYVSVSYFVQCGIISVDVPVQDLIDKMQDVTRNSVNLFETSDVKRLGLW